VSPSSADAADELEEGPPFNPERLVDTLARHGVQYVLVGGMGAQLHGATRTTTDLDCLPLFEAENTRRLAAAMRELHARLRAEGLSDAESIQLTSHLPSPEFFQHGEISNWMTDAGPLDVLHDMPDREGHRLGYEQLIGRTSEAVHAGVTVRLAALDDIVASKEYANRDKDHEALPELYALQEQQRGEGPAASGLPAKLAPRPDRGGPGGRTLANGLDHPGGAQGRSPERGIER